MFILIFIQRSSSLSSITDEKNKILCPSVTHMKWIKSICAFVTKLRSDLKSYKESLLMWGIFTNISAEKCFPLFFYQLTNRWTYFSDWRIASLQNIYFCVLWKSFRPMWLSRGWAYTHSYTHTHTHKHAHTITHTKFVCKVWMTLHQYQSKYYRPIIINITVSVIRINKHQWTTTIRLCYFVLTSGYASRSLKGPLRKGGRKRGGEGGKWKKYPYKIYA